MMDEDMMNEVKKELLEDFIEYMHSSMFEKKQEMAAEEPEMPEEKPEMPEEKPMGDLGGEEVDEYMRGKPRESNPGGLAVMIGVGKPKMPMKGKKK